MGESILLSIYIMTSVFGIGVTIIDMIGLIGSHHDDDDSAEDFDTDDGDTGGDHDLDTDLDGDIDSDFDTDHDTDFDSDHDGDDLDTDNDTDHDGDSDDSGHEGGDRGSLVSDDDEYEQRRQKRSPVILIMSMLRAIVYFALGFGPIGLIALLTGTGVFFSLVWSIPVGIISLVGIKLIKRIQRSKLDSQVKPHELLMSKAEVLVTINPGLLGQVRIFLGDTIIDQYARAENPSQKIPVGETVYVTEVKADCVIVATEDSFISGNT